MRTTRPREAATDTAISAKANPEVWFIGVDQAPCIDEAGAPDPTFTCAGDLATLLPNFIGLQYAEDQAGYLAGIVAASLSENANIGAIGGINLVPAVVRYIQGYEMGAKSVNPDIVVNSAYVSTSDFGVAFNDPGAGKTFAEQFIDTNSPDVLFQVAGKTGNGVLEAACEAGIHGVGVDVDQWLSLAADTTPAYQCIVTSAEKKLASSVQQTIEAIAGDTATPGVNVFNAANGGVGVSPEHGTDLITDDIQALLDAALATYRAELPPDSAFWPFCSKSCAVTPASMRRNTCLVCRDTSACRARSPSTSIGTNSSFPSGPMATRLSLRYDSGSVTYTGSALIG